MFNSASVKRQNGMGQKSKENFLNEFSKFSYGNIINQPFFNYFENLEKPPHENIEVDEEWIHMTFLLDRSGSMCTFSTKDIIKSIKGFISDQMANEKNKKVSITIISFDESLCIVFDDFVKTIEDVKFSQTDIEPRDMTALNEATAFTIEFTGRKLSNWGTTIGETRPGNVVFATMTDGEENSSVKEWSLEEGKSKLSEIVKEHTEKWGWKFFFLAANIDSKETGSQLGYDPNQCIDFHTSSQGYDNAFRSCSQAVTENRGFSDLERAYCSNPN